MGADDMEARTPAPEGEASLWGCADGNGIDPRLVFRDRPTAEQVAADMNMVVQPLYTSPVVPVGVSREEIAAGDIIVCKRHGKWMADVVGDTAHSGGWSSPVDAVRGVKKYADAILAALRPTDTGRE
jgi:hypothetical protein